MDKQPKDFRGMRIEIEIKDDYHLFDGDIIKYSHDDLFVIIQTDTEVISIPIMSIIKISQSWYHLGHLQSEPFSDEQWNVDKK